ncbi:MAG: T9SS type A sorting domain-containing protein, partial [Bacteroidia bacterium]|nr:T9SS type A sorting domain-containing protein [Bacteroidia bacterium]
IPEALNVRVELLSLSGELIGTVTNELYTAGFHQKLFSLHTYPAGAYLIRMQAGSQSFAKTLVIAR